MEGSRGEALQRTRHRRHHGVGNERGVPSSADYGFWDRRELPERGPCHENEFGSFHSTAGSVDTGANHSDDTEVHVLHSQNKKKT